jgi:hypothetical protein
MVGFQTLVAVSILTFVKITVAWTHFDSTTYPYSVTQPSSYRHVVLRDTANRLVDYFFPSLGTFTTNVNIVAYRGDTLPNEVTYMRSLGGHHVAQVGNVKIAGQTVPVVQGRFTGVVAHYTLVQVAFTDSGLIWRLTCSYDDRFARLRHMLMRIIRSFQLRSVQHH